MSEPGRAASGVRSSRAITLLLIVAITVLVDQVTKQWVLTVLTPGEFVPFIGAHIGWQLLFNTGGAFGLAAPAWLFLTVAGFVTVLVLRVLTQQPSALSFVGFALLLGGAYGNIVDRLFRATDGFASGAVVDFVAWGSFPRFNVADSAITVGVALVFIALLCDRENNAPSEAPDGPPDSHDAL